MTDAELREIEERANAATGGPWTWQWARGGEIKHGNDVVARVSNDEDWRYESHNCGYVPCNYPDPDDGCLCDLSEHDAKFICAARSDIPRLIEALREAWARIGMLERASGNHVTGKGG